METTYHKGLGSQESKQEVSKVLSLIKDDEKSSKCIQTPIKYQYVRPAKTQISLRIRAC